VSSPHSELAIAGGPPQKKRTKKKNPKEKKKKRGNQPHSKPHPKKKKPQPKLKVKTGQEKNFITGGVSYNSTKKQVTRKKTLQLKIIKGGAK